MGNSKYSRQYVTGFSLHYDIILKKLIDHLFEKEIIDSDTKWTFTQYCILRTLFDYADEVVKGFQYTPEQLTALIEEHERLKNKFERKLKEIAGILEEKSESDGKNVLKNWL